MIKRELLRVSIDSGASGVVRSCTQTAGGWISLAVFSGPCHDADQSPEELARGIVYGVACSEIRADRDQAEGELLGLLLQMGDVDA